MDMSGHLLLACCIAGITGAGVAGGAAAQPPAAPGAASQSVTPQRDMAPYARRVPIQAPARGDDRGVLVPTTIEYHWIIRVPVVSVERRRIKVTAPSVSSHWTRWNYEIPALRDKRIKLWDAPEFSCKYPDLTLPNECRTVWHGVYVDVPRLITERGHVDVELPRIDVTEQSILVDVPRWTWVDKSFRLSLPAVASPETLRRLRAALSLQRAEMAATTEATIASVSHEIESLRASGHDPSRLKAADGATLDLVAHRQSLVDQRAQELDRLAEIDAELAQLSAR